ncbi:hypothetical protein BHF71_06720 [Vulcanibacillus modesticaldus]|uniref:N-acetyltransferase domain-containing protein n=1 Tax=Vulcanibacillus modesticaldus TaxID=337097 RepID=A0A1D2YWH1_9BACI|nr:GNAT family N-acetyltransferase [Vulcanibacillus modesticaldus]OEG00049.1 hypothetical protein BHF71_06720 [Vulcanibacillus modesticaldus]
MTQLNYQIVTTRKELNDAFDVRRIVFIQEQHVPEKIEMDKYDDHSTHFIVYHDEKPIATARIRIYNNENTVKIERVAVLKEFRGKGIGKKLMLFAEQEAKKMGFTTFLLNSQRHAEIFYKKLGYITISEPFKEAGIEHVTMKKKI